MAMAISCLRTDFTSYLEEQEKQERYCMNMSGRKHGDWMLFPPLTVSEFTNQLNALSASSGVMFRNGLKA